jgi:hypothetical protein
MELGFGRCRSTLRSKGAKHRTLLQYFGTLRFGTLRWHLSILSAAKKARKLLIYIIYAKKKCTTRASAKGGFLEGCHFRLLAPFDC